MKQRILFLALAGMQLTAKAQNNPIFYGGSGDGHSVLSWMPTTNHGNLGGPGDGYAGQPYLQILAPAHAGGAGDGWSGNGYLPLVSTTVKGGSGDGFSGTFVLQTTDHGNSGGEGDGWGSMGKAAYQSAWNKGGAGDGWASTYNPLAPLPVGLISFDAKKRGTQGLLTWVAGHVNDVVKFDVERSADAVHFTYLGSVVPHAMASDPYELIDERPMPGHNYYRLRVQYQSGKISYSGARLLVFADTQQPSLQVYPNPANEQVNLVVSDEIEGRQLVVNIYDAAGKLVLHRQVLASEKVIRVSTVAFAQGTYYIHLSAGGFSSLNPVVVQH